jgi:ATP-dependent DNA helicase RecQ
MRSFAVIDTEVNDTGKIVDLAALLHNGCYVHTRSIPRFAEFLDGSQTIVGHNIFKHDLPHLQNAGALTGLDELHVIDTLHLSPLYFPTQPYHALVKDDKLQSGERNNPLNDAIKCRDLFADELSAFNKLPQVLQQIFFLLLKDQTEFRGFFQFLGFRTAEHDAVQRIKSFFDDQICSNADLPVLLRNTPVELAYSLSLIHSGNRYSITPPWVLKNYPRIDNVLSLLRNRPCLTGCSYCNRALDVHLGLKEFFGFGGFRRYGGEPLQEKAVQAAVDHKSLLAVFPTGGGKSLTFQLPALMAGRSMKGLTVVISPLQSLMKDQVDNLDKIGITEAATINGLLEPVERGEAFRKVEEGHASLLYIAPEMLRSKTVEKILSGRKIVRFVIDEAHCFSSWGHDFRVDYHYIAEFIRALQEKKNLPYPIPVSCFTATAKPQVIEDICHYFRRQLSVELEIFRSEASRTNLHYRVFEKSDDEKYVALRDLLMDKDCPAIVYVSRTKHAAGLARKLSEDGILSRSFYGKMDSREKIRNQDDFISGHIRVIVATSAFGMGVDKKDVGLVIHYDISDSLENYVQEAGRAGRNEQLEAECFILFNEDDLARHFVLLNQTRLTVKEIQQVWKAIKDATRFRTTLAASVLEIARKAGWDDSIADMETRVTTAIAALEEAGYLKRGQNSPRIFANSILSKTVEEAAGKIYTGNVLTEREKENAVRIIKKLFSSKSRNHASGDAGESRVDYIADSLGIERKEVAYIIEQLRAEGILADSKDLTAYIRRGEQRNRPLAMVDSFNAIENFLLGRLDEQATEIHLKSLSEEAEQYGLPNVSPDKFRTILNYWAVRKWIRRTRVQGSAVYWRIELTLSKELFQERQQKRRELARFIMERLYERSLGEAAKPENKDKPELLVNFSVAELKAAFEQQPGLFERSAAIADVEDTLFYLSRIDAIKLDGGFLVFYSPLTISRVETDNRKKYTLDDYQKFAQFYQSKIQQIHIVGEYAKKMVRDYQDALQFMHDYFHLDYEVFLERYFPGSRKTEIRQSITPAKFRELIGSLSPAQLDIVKESGAKKVVVAAGPGSGKTKVLVHKLASLLLLEEVKHEQLLMLTFSRAAATLFKKRLLKLVGNAAHFIEIRTFHSYCFDLLGRIGSLDKAGSVVELATERIRNGEVETSRITKMVLVIDEAQDMNASEFALVEALIERNEDLRVIAVGDDDQNIYGFRHADSRYMASLLTYEASKQFDLTLNYRSKANLVDFCNQFVPALRRRMKNTPAVAQQPDDGKIHLTTYADGHLVMPVVKNVLSAKLSGSIGVLTVTNEEAAMIFGILSDAGRKARLIRSNDDFNLYNLEELRFFMNQIAASGETIKISDHTWASARKRLREQFPRSANLPLCLKLIEEFEATSGPARYLTDLGDFIRELKLDDLYDASGGMITVSTIHKAKGREFDHVFLLLDKRGPLTDEEKRAVYVGLTRAKTQLHIHTKGKYFERIRVSNFVKTVESRLFAAPDVLIIPFGLRDVFLDGFTIYQPLIQGLGSGDRLQPGWEDCRTLQGETVLRFSRAFQRKLSEWRNKGYVLKMAKVNFIIYWQMEQEAKEIKVLLGEVRLAREK